MGLGNKYFLLELIMKDNGKMILFKDMVDTYLKMVIITQESLFMGKEKVLECWSIKMVHHMKANG